ncbi:hypothetical protein E1A91_A13G127100v1 [Gossypium mustelinum]|uniref:Uncharacterized protein n=6 Tax=Gossypium TaxID=3633 RepID=A0A2P5Y7D4_GOSBA|nr:hypothetical protein ES319_A13G122600v1 [Gossypium barbadense]PPS11514.1 hypothetical protein GOBAR_AA09133 [Gossypium barbadense]TYG86379.1 hypothetical protein ES288_A13G129700v1 [Gossypium darwinii]TYJ01041.1 hypothetical protein E1A91_A13G127100v1 [Gossypium mustelinum]
MGFLKQTSVFKISLLFTLFFISSTAQFGAAIRPTHWQEEQLFRKIVPHFETLQRGLLPPSGGSPCTNIPGGSGTCVVNEINAAGHLLRSRPAFPGVHVIKAAGTTSMGE